MAWSDAARAAALEARRAHAMYKKDYRDQTSRNLTAGISREARLSTAKQVRDLRRNWFDAGDYYRHQVMSEAAASTRLRNLQRAASKSFWDSSAALRRIKKADAERKMFAKAKREITRLKKQGR